MRLQGTIRAEDTVTLEGVGRRECCIVVGDLRLIFADTAKRLHAVEEQMIV